MKKLCDYRVVEVMYLEGLIKSVNQLVSDGWRPIGGMAVSVSPKGEIYYQAMIKDKETHAKQSTKTR